MCTQYVWFWYIDVKIEEVYTADAGRWCWCRQLNMLLMLNQTEHLQLERQ